MFQQSCRSFDKSTFNRLNFSAVDLIKLTKTYNAKFPSTNKNFVVEITQNKRVFGLMLGVHKTNVRQYSWTHEASNVTPSVGAWMAFDIHPKVPFQLNVELEYAPFKTNAFRQRSIIVYKYADSLSFQSNYVRANALFKYAYRVDKKASIYAKFGASFATSVKNTVRQVAASYDELLLKGTIFITKPKIRTVDLGFITALGVQYDRAAVEFRYRLSNGYSSAEMIRTSVDDVSLTAFWDFAPNKVKIKSQIRQ